MSETFDREIVSRLAIEDEVVIRTSPGVGKPTRGVTIWVVVVVVDGKVYVRSVRGPSGRWYRVLRKNPLGALRVGDRFLAVRAVPVGDPESIGKVSNAYLLRATIISVKLAALFVYASCWVVTGNPGDSGAPVVRDPQTRPLAIRLASHFCCASMVSSSRWTTPRI